MAVVGGIILWLVMIALIAGYFLMKKYGEKRESNFRSFTESKRMSEEEEEKKTEEGVNNLKSGR